METKSRNTITHTLESKLEAIKLHEDGFNVSAIARRLNISNSNIHYWLKRYKAYGLSGLEGRRRRIMTGKEKIAMMHDVIDNSLSLTEAAFKYDVSQSRVRDWRTKVIAYGYKILTVKYKYQRRPVKITDNPFQPLTPEQTLRLQKEICRLKMENARFRRMKHPL